MVSALSEVEVAVTAMKRGAYHYITKEFDYNGLRSLVRNALERQTLSRQLITGAFPISRSRAHTHRRHGHPLQTVPSAGLIERPQEKNRVDALR